MGCCESTDGSSETSEQKKQPVKRKKSIEAVELPKDVLEIMMRHWYRLELPKVITEIIKRYMDWELVSELLEHKNLRKFYFSES